MSAEYMRFTAGRHLILAKMPSAAANPIDPDATPQNLICHLIDRSAWTVQLAWDQVSFVKVNRVIVHAPYES